MMHKADIDIVLLGQLLTYETSSGKLYWNERTAEHIIYPAQRKTWNKRFAGKEAGHVNVHGYVEVGLHGLNFMAHRIAFALENGRWPDGEIDHINGSRSDNRWSNLRLVTTLENAKNRRVPKHNKSGVMGVDRHQNRWRATIKHNGKYMYLGSFQSKDEAAAAWRRAADQYGYHANHGRAQLAVKDA